MITVYLYISFSGVDSSSVQTQKCLDGYCSGRKHGKPEIVKDIYGKPHSNIPGVYLSVSHAPPAWVCAVASAPIGIDIERTDVKIAEPLHSFLLTNNDASVVKTWTKLESCSKLRGSGLHEDLDSLMMCIQSGRFHFFDVKLDDNYCCTVCMSSDIEISNIDILIMPF